MGRKSNGTLVLAPGIGSFPFSLATWRPVFCLAVTYLHSFLRRIRKIMWVLQTSGIPIALGMNVLQAIAQKQVNTATVLWLSMKVFR